MKKTEEQRMKDNILEIQNLKVIFPTEMGIVRAVEGISLEIVRGKCVALVGESGCGKSVTSLAAMKLLNPDAGSCPCRQTGTGWTRYHKA